MSPRVSVLMPVYNEQRYVLGAAASILSQTMTDLELIIVDDGSTDATPERLAELADPRVLVLRQDNSGMAAALNAGAALANAPYLARMDADDVSYPRRLERQADFLDTHPAAAFVGTAYDRIDDEGRVVDMVTMLSSDSELRRDLFTCCPFGHGTVMLRADALRAAGGYDGSFWPAEDYDLWRRLMAEHEAANLPEVLYGYRLHGGNSSTAQQQDIARRIQDDLWRTVPPPALARTDMRRELSAYDRLEPALRQRFRHVYAEQQAALLKQALVRRRWQVVRGLLPAAAPAAAAAVRRLAGQGAWAASPISRKTDRNRA